jgi:phosphatidylglycerophosphate synthase
MLSHKKSKIEAYLAPVIPFLANVNPNLLTLLGSIPPLLFFVFVLTHHYIFALIVYFGNGFDMLDGMVARKFKKVTAFGGLFDSTMDRVSDFLLITAFAFGSIVRWEIIAPFLLFAFLTGYIRSRGLCSIQYRFDRTS